MSQPKVDLASNAKIVIIVTQSMTKPPDIRRLALEMYLEGLGFRQIGRVLKISYTTVYNWVKKWGASVELPVREDAIRGCRT